MNPILRLSSDQAADDALLPLVDVVFILVFALATMVSEQAPVSVQLASVQANTSRSSGDSEHDRPVLQIGRNASLVLDGQPIERGDLLPALQRRFATSLDKTVVLKPDRDLTYQPLVDIRQLLTTAGLDVVEHGQVANNPSEP